MGRMAELAAELEEMAGPEMDGPENPEDCERDPRDDEPGLCGCCNGSGEGMYDGSTCYVCRGSGVERDSEAEAEREAERADYLHDQRKDDQMLAGVEDTFPDDDLPF